MSLGREPAAARSTDWRAVLADLDGAYAPRTIEALLSRFARFEASCRARGAAALPTSPAEVAAHVAELATWRATATIRKRLWAIRCVHLHCGFPDPTRGRLVEMALRRAVRAPGRPADPPRPLHFAEMERLAAAAPATPRGLRDRLMVRLAYDTLCRASELVKLRLEDVEHAPDGTARVRVRAAKNDPLGEGDWAHISAATVEVLRDWQAATGLETGWILRRIRRHYVCAAHMGVGRVRPQMKALAAAAGSPDLRRLRAHSARIGAAQDLVMAGCSLLEVMRAGRWRDPRVLVRYVRDAPVNVWAVVDRPEPGDARPLVRRPIDRTRTGRRDLPGPRAGGTPREADGDLARR